MGKIYPKGSEVIASRNISILIDLKPVVNMAHIAISGEKGNLTEDFRPGDTYASIKWEWHDYKDSVLFEYGKDFRFTE